MTSHKQRTVLSHDVETYSFVNYVSYALYPPLFIAGPIITFNDFMWQVSLSLASYARAVRSQVVHAATETCSAQLAGCTLLPDTLLRLHHDVGIHPPLHVCSSHQRPKGVGWILRCRALHGRFLEPYCGMAQGAFSPASYL